MRSISPGLALLLVMLSASCGGGDGDPYARNDWPRVARQDLLDASGGVISSFRLDYDASGLPLGVRTYDGADVLVSTTTYAYQDGHRTLATVRNPAGEVTSSTEYAYSGGVLSGSTSRSATGAVSLRNTYEFSGGRKITTRRFDAQAVLVGRVEFTYDETSRLRTGSTTYSGNEAVTGTSTRSYSEGRLSEVHLLAGSVATTRTFQYEAGPNVIDNEQFFEF